MITFIFAVLLLLLAFLALLLEKTYFYLPPKELKREAAHGDALARTLFQAAAYGNELRAVLWFVVGIAAAGSFVLFVSIAPTIFGLIVVALVIWLAFVWLPRARLSLMYIRLATWCTPMVVRLLRFLHPVTQFAAAYAGRYPVGPHTGMYERNDIYELVERQKRQSDNRISDHDLSLMRNILQFSDYHVQDTLVPRKQVKAVSVDDNVGPLFLDDLHASGHVCFPVFDGKPSNVVGLLVLDDVADVKHHGRVRDHYRHHLAYVHENDSLEQALRTFYEARQHLCIVINSHSEYVGIITLGDVLNKLLGEAQKDAAETRHDDRQAVATRHQPPEPESSSADESDKKLPENPPEVVK